MTSERSFEISRLRAIGWSAWDPIGLLHRGEAWHGQRFADEYDEYLLRVASILRAGGEKDDCIAYLEWASSENMGLGAPSETGRRASAATVQQIADYVRELDR